MVVYQISADQLDNVTGKLPRLEHNTNLQERLYSFWRSKAKLYSIRIRCISWVTEYILRKIYRGGLELLWYLVLGLDSTSSNIRTQKGTCHIEKRWRVSPNFLIQDIVRRTHILKGHTISWVELERCHLSAIVDTLRIFYSVDVTKWTWNFWKTFQQKKNSFRFFRESKWNRGLLDKKNVVHSFPLEWLAYVFCINVQSDKFQLRNFRLMSKSSLQCQMIYCMMMPTYAMFATKTIMQSITQTP